MREEEGEGGRGKERGFAEVREQIEQDETWGSFSPNFPPDETHSETGQKTTKFTIPPSPRPPTPSKTTSSQKHKILTKTPEFLANTTIPPSPKTHQNT